MYSNKPSFVFGFHGLDETIGREIINGDKQLIASTNSYDWLGHGIYFWEHSQERALQWAQQQSKKKRTTVIKPFVIGAVIDLGCCLDLLDQKWLDFLATQYQLMVDGFKNVELPLPQNKPINVEDFDFKNRELDCAVVRYAIESAKKQGLVFDTVRAAFWEGKELYPNAGFRAHNHVQISVINPDCVKGVFLPRSRKNK